MNGHQALIAMRRKGVRVAAIFVADGQSDFDLDKSWTHPIMGSRFAHVRIDEIDIPEALDLRFAVGMQVHIDGYRSEARAKRLHDAFVAADAKIVGTIYEEKEWVHHG